jgi:hypothetical protein
MVDWIDIARSAARRHPSEGASIASLIDDDFEIAEGMAGDPSDAGAPPTSRGRARRRWSTGGVQTGNNPSRRHVGASDRHLPERITRK